MQPPRKIWKLMKYTREHIKCNILFFKISLNKITKTSRNRSYNRCCRLIESSTKEVSLRLSVFLWIYWIWIVMIEWPSNEAQSFCVWFEVKWNFNWRPICAVIRSTPGTCLTTGLMTNFSRNFTNDSFNSNSSQFSIYTIILSRYYDFRITWDWGSLFQFSSIPMVSNYPPLPFPPSFQSLSLLMSATQARQILAFRAHQ